MLPLDSDVHFGAFSTISSLLSWDCLLVGCKVPNFLQLCPLVTPQIPNHKFTLIIVFSKFRVGWVNSVPQHVNKQTNKGNNVASIATTDSKKNKKKST